KVLDLNRTQTSVLTMVFKYCDDQKLPLLDLEDLRTTLKYLSSDEGKDVLDEYGGVAKSHLSVVVRALAAVGGAGGGGGVWRAGVRGRGGDGADARGPRCDQPAGALRRDGAAPSVQHVHALDAGAGVRGAARGRGSARAEARVLLRRGPPALR